jgi:hypothetical protein
MNIQRRKHRIARRRLLAGEWKPTTSGGPENALFDRCFELAEASHDLEQVAGTRGTTAAMAASLGCATSAFDSLANSMLMMRRVVLGELDGVEADGTESDRAESGESAPAELGRLLYAIDQNLRFAAHAADLGRQTAESSRLDQRQGAAAL